MCVEARETETRMGGTGDPIGVPSSGLFLPFIEAVSGDETTRAAHRVPKGRMVLGALDPGVDRARAVFGIFRPMRKPAPGALFEPPILPARPDRPHFLGGGDVVARRELPRLFHRKGLRQLPSGARECEATTHDRYRSAGWVIPRIPGPGPTYCDASSAAR